MAIQIRRTKSTQEPTGLLEGQLSVNLTVPPRLWVGADGQPGGRLLIADGSYATQQQLENAISALREEVLALISAGPGTNVTHQYVTTAVNTLRSTIAEQYARIGGVAPIAPPAAGDTQPATQQYVYDALNTLRGEVADQYVRIAGVAVIMPPAPPAAGNATLQYVTDAVDALSEEVALQYVRIA